MIFLNINSPRDPVTFYIIQNDSQRTHRGLNGTKQSVFPLPFWVCLPHLVVFFLIPLPHTCQIHTSTLRPWTQHVICPQSSSSDCLNGVPLYCSHMTEWEVPSLSSSYLYYLFKMLLILITVYIPTFSLFCCTSATWHIVYLFDYCQSCPTRK